MKVLLVNGSPHRDGCTYTALKEAAGVLEAAGIETEFWHLGNRTVYGCTDCSACAKTGKCVHEDANELGALIREADGVIFGTPVYYGSANGAFCAVLDRVFYSGSGFAGKPAAAVVSCRRGGASAAFDRLNKYFTISGMTVAGSTYWNSVHGNTPEEVRRDEEGLETMRNIAHHMVWLLQNKKEAPVFEHGAVTNFIR